MDLWRVDYWARSRSCSFFFAPLTRGNRSGPLSKRKEKKGKKKRDCIRHTLDTLRNPANRFIGTWLGLWLCSKNIGGSGCTKRDGFQRWRLPATSTEEGRTPNVIGVACTYMLHVHIFSSKDTYMYTCTWTGICTWQKLRSEHHPGDQLCGNNESQVSHTPPGNGGDQTAGVVSSLELVKWVLMIDSVNDGVGWGRGVRSRNLPSSQDRICRETAWLQAGPSYQFPGCDWL